MFVCPPTRHKVFLACSQSIVSAWMLLVLVLLLPSCNPAEEEPAYVTIDNVVEASSGLEAADLAITEVWVFANGTFLGAYTLPARIPVLLSGPTDIEVQMGIRVNGVNETPDTYPFYAAVQRNLELVPGNTYPLGVLPVSYGSNASFLIQEDFEVGTPRVFTQSLLGERGLELDNSTVFQGNGSGLLRLDEGNPAVEIVSEQLYSNLTSQSQGNVWLEVSYLSEVTVLWGIVGSEPGQPLQQFYEVGFRPRSSWQKIYFNLTRTVVVSELESLNFGLRAFLSDSNEDNGSVWLDNIRVIYEIP